MSLSPKSPDALALVLQANALTKAHACRSDRQVRFSRVVSFARDSHPYAMSGGRAASSPPIALHSRSVNPCLAHSLIV